VKKALIALGFLSAFSLGFAENPQMSIKDQETIDFYNNPTGNPSFYPKVKYFIDPFIKAEFTFWEITSSDFGFYRTGLRTTENVENARGTVHEVKTKGVPGFKIALGGVTAHGGWDILSRYTYVNFSNSGKASNTTQAGLPSHPIHVGNSRSFEETAPTSAKASEHLRVNILDFEWGRKFYNSRFLALRFLSGVSALWAPTEGRYQYNFSPATAATELEVDNVAVSGPVVVKETGDVWGIGPKFGFETNWFFMQNFSAFARFALTPAYHNIDATRVENVFDGANLATNLANERVKGFSHLAAWSEFQLGINGDCWFSDNSYCFSFNLLYEIQYWPAIRPRIGDQVFVGLIGAHGLTAGASLKF